MLPPLSPWIATPLGFLLLWLGAEALVHGARRIAVSLGISPLVIGLTLVAFGTSLPEFLVCVTAALQGTPDFAVGNVVGSDIANVGLIGGVAALIAVMAVKREILIRDLPWSIGAGLLLWGFAMRDSIGRVAGAVMLVAFAVYLFQLWRAGGGLAEDEVAEIDQTRLSLSKMLIEGGIALVGLVMLGVGAPMLLEGATAIARAVGISDLVIGLTLIALGTSLPELATALVAAYRGHPELALGNIVGSNIFNILLVMGATAVVHPVAVAPLARVQDIPVMLGLMGILLIMGVTGRRVARGEGAILLLVYLGYVGWLFLRSA